MAKQTNVNIDCTTRYASQAFFELKTLLIACGWVIVGTSDGTTAVNAPSPDQVPTVALFDVANAWYVLRDPASKVWLYVQRRTSNNTFLIQVSVDAPTVAGTATVVPTGAASVTTLVNVTNPFTGGSGSPRAQIIAYDAAENAAGIQPFYLLFTQGSSTLLGSLILEAFANDTYAAGNASPFVVSWGSANNGVANSGASTIWRHSPTSAWTPQTAFAWFQTTTVLAGSGTMGVDPWSSNDQGAPVLSGRGVAQSQPGLGGLWKNIRLRCVNRGYPDTFTTSGGETYVYAGDLIVPYANGVTPL